MFYSVYRSSKFRWFVVGVFTYLIDVGLFVYMANDIGTILANLISSGVALCFNFLMHHYWSFGSSNKLSFSTVLKYTLQYIFTWLIATVIILITQDFFGDYLAKTISIIATLPLGYFLLKKWVFI